jgi:hypothetical protein
MGWGDVNVQLAQNCGIVKCGSPISWNVSNVVKLAEREGTRTYVTKCVSSVLLKTIARNIIRSNTFIVMADMHANM